MDLTWLGHSCFRVRSRDFALVTDPFGGDGWQPPLRTTGSVVTVSNDHPNHATVESVAGSPRVLRRPGEYEIGGALIWGVRTSGGPRPDGSLPARNTAFVIQLEDITVCHLGDITQPLTAEQLTHIKDSQVLLLPVGGQCTIDAAQAVAVVAQIEPRIVIPMHYASGDGASPVALDSVERFCREMGAADVTPQPRLTVTNASLPLESTVVLLEARR